MNEIRRLGLTVLVIYLVHQTFKFSARTGLAFMATPLFLPVLLGFVGWNMYTTAQTKKMFPEDPRLEATDVNTQQTFNVDGVPDSLHAIEITFKNYFQREVAVPFAICSMQGPIFYSKRWNTLNQYPHGETDPEDIYLGDRHIIVTLFAVKGSKLDEDGEKDLPTMSPATYRKSYKPAVPSEEKVKYLSTTPNDFLCGRDELEWCEAGDNLQALATKRHLTVDSHSVVQGQRVYWASSRVAYSVSNLIIPANPALIRAAAAEKF